MLRKSSWQQTLAIATLSAIGTTAATVLGANPAQAASFVLDSFNDNHILPVATPQTTGTVVVSDGSNGVLGEIVGGERDVIATRNSGGNVGSFAGQVTGGFAIFNTGAGATGTFSFTYDGADGTTDTIDYAGLNNLDLTGGGVNNAVIYSIVGNVSESALLTVTAYSDENNFSSLQGEIPVGTVGGELAFLFDDFAIDSGVGADLANVNAVVLEVTGTPAFDLVLDQVEFGTATNAIPEGDVTIGTLMGGALLGFLKFRKRFSAKSELRH